MVAQLSVARYAISNWQNIFMEDKDKSDLVNILTRTKISKNSQIYEKYFKVLG